MCYLCFELCKLNTWSQLLLIHIAISVSMSAKSVCLNILCCNLNGSCTSAYCCRSQLSDLITFQLSFNHIQILFVSEGNMTLINFLPCVFLASWMEFDCYGMHLSLVVYLSREFQSQTNFLVGENLANLANCELYSPKFSLPFSQIHQKCIWHMHWL